MTPTDLATAGGRAPGYPTGDDVVRGTVLGSELRHHNGSYSGHGCACGALRRTGGAGDPDSYRYAPHSRGHAPGASPGPADDDYNPF